MTFQPSEDPSIGPSPDPSRAPARKPVIRKPVVRKPMMRKPLPFALVTLALAALCAVFVLHPFSPDLPGSGLDPSWAAVVGEAAARRARWGIDIAFTYGPAAPLVTTYYDANYLWLTLPCLLALSLVHGLLAAALLTAHRATAAVAAVLCYAVALVTLCVQQTGDAFFFTTILLVFVLDLDRAPGDRVARLAVGLGTVATGMFCLGKLSYGVAALPLFLIADLVALGRRRPPFRVVLAGLGFLGANALYGQRLADLPAFLASETDIIGGYTAAMSVPGSARELAAFLVLAATLVAVAAWSERRGERLVLPIGLAAFLFVAFKAGFVRHDLHSLTAWACLGGAGVVLGVSRVAARSVAAGASLTLAGLVLLLRVYPYILLTGSGEVPDAGNMVGVYESWLGERARAEMRGFVRTVTDPAEFKAGLDRDKAEAWAAVRAAAPLPALDGTVDILQSEQSRVMAAGLAFHPRPSFQEYSTYAPGLIEANQTFYEGPDAPDWLIFAPGSIDDRTPAFAEGPLWPVLLRRYAPARWIGESVALRRRAEPGPEGLGTPLSVTAGLDETVPVPVPVPGDGAVFARIVVRPTGLGRLAGLLFRPPMLTMVVRLADGREIASRFIPALGAGGFVLSPRIETARDYVRLAAGDGAALAPSRVVSVRIAGGRTASLAYGAEIAFAFTPLAIPETPSAAAARRLLETAPEQ